MHAHIHYQRGAHTLPRTGPRVEVAVGPEASWNIFILMHAICWTPQKQMMKRKQLVCRIFVVCCAPLSPNFSPWPHFPSFFFFSPLTPRDSCVGEQQTTQISYTLLQAHASNSFQPTSQSSASVLPALGIKAEETSSFPGILKTFSV